MTGSRDRKRFPESTLILNGEETKISELALGLILLLPSWGSPLKWQQLFLYTSLQLIYGERANHVTLQVAANKKLWCNISRERSTGYSKERLSYLELSTTYKRMSKFT
ncbi:hypothetical protein Ccrd_012350 [Cynara cardunculus var. scolymus]|uniref:Uncharacterized protein n=1 Tax=Cynara cardunculus var. scolymus TaxID=59895 RepID=A0A103YHL3_CYNCS|nr:hypothetical protein Ccrd_012350 [Cynara cardunculus var. scolymus]